MTATNPAAESRQTTVCLTCATLYLITDGHSCTGPHRLLTRADEQAWGELLVELQPRPTVPASARGGRHRRRVRWPWRWLRRHDTTRARLAALEQVVAYLAETEQGNVRDLKTALGLLLTRGLQ